VATRETESDVYWYSIKYPLHFHVFASCRCCSHRLITASAKSTVRVITLSTQNCTQSGSQNTRPLPHMNLNVSERERECCLLVLSLVSSTLPCIRQPRLRLKKTDLCSLWSVTVNGPCDREPLSSSEAPRAPELDSVQGLSIPVRAQKHRVRHFEIRHSSSPSLLIVYF
jgi:hypothetical protein